MQLEVLKLFLFYTALYEIKGRKKKRKGHLKRLSFDSFFTLRQFFFDKNALSQTKHETDARKLNQPIDCEQFFLMKPYHQPLQI